MILVCHLISQVHVIICSCDLMGRSHATYETIILSFKAIVTEVVEIESF